MTRHQTVMAVALVALLGGGLGVVAFADHPHAQAPSTRMYATSTVRRTELSETTLVNGTLGWSPARPAVFRCRGTWTWLPDPGVILPAGAVVARADDRPIVLLPGLVPAWRAMGPGAAPGPDIGQLQAALVALGYDPYHRIAVDGRFTAATARAVRRWQTALGVPASGTVLDGDVIFAAAPLRIGAVTATVGSPTQPGDIPFATTGTARTVSVALDPARQDQAHRGQAVTVDLLNGRTLHGQVTSVSSVATRTTDNAGQVTASVALTVLLAGAQATGLPDGASVQVALVTASHRNVLAVPVTALLALAEGGYGLELVSPGGTHHVIAVRTGLFAGQDVEVAAAGLTDGATVVVAR